MHKILIYTFFRLVMMFFLTVALISFEKKTSYSIADFIFSELCSFLESEQMEEEAEAENELNSGKKIEEFIADIQLIRLVSTHASRSFVISSDFFPEDVSPPPKLVLFS